MTDTPAGSSPAQVLRAPAETTYAEELATLATADQGPRPTGWRLTPRAVRAFVVGDQQLGVSRKFYGDDPLVARVAWHLDGVPESCDFGAAVLEIAEE